MFELDKRLDNDTWLIGDLPLSRVLLMNDSQFPWVILVPRRDAIREVVDLEPDDRQALWHESDQVSEALLRVFSAHKLNVAALGNVVSQLHVHHIARFTDDCAWPHPVWGRQPTKAYTQDEAALHIDALAQHLTLI